MNAVAVDVREKLAFILHWGCVEIRNLSFPSREGDAANLEAERFKHINDLADLLEWLPQFMMRDLNDNDIKLVRVTIRDYCRRHPNSTYRYLEQFDADELRRWYGDFPTPDFDVEE